jgi:hypothetical protein
MATPTLENFSAEIRKSNIARPYLYFVSLTLPPVLALGDKVSMPDLKKISLFCHGAQTPQLNFSTNDSYVEAGIKRRFAYDYDYQDLMLQFYVDQDYLIPKFFDRWKEAMTNSRRNFGYPDDYTSTNIDLYMIDMTGVVKHSYSYRNVHPKIINNITLDYGSGGAMSLPVSFVFETVVSAADVPPADIVESANEIRQATAFKNPELSQEIKKSMGWVSPGDQDVAGNFEQIGFGA